MSSRPRGSAAAGLPAWKQAILERKRAKLAAGVELPKGGGGGGALTTQHRPPPPASPGAEGKEPAAAKEEKGEAERLVVAESLGPLRENPFMRLESERRRRRRRVPQPLQPPPPPSSPEPPPPPPAASSPSAAAETPALAQLLELYSSMPGIRTIRADNILIIESRGDEADGRAPPGRGPSPGRGAGAAGDVAPGAALWRRRRRQQQQPLPEEGEPRRPPGASPSPPRPARDPLRQLLARSGSPVTEIRAAEVVIYEPQQAPRTPPPPAAADDPGSEPGRVSRLLEKFDSRRPRGSAGRGRWRGGEAPCPETLQAAAVPNAYSEEAALPLLASATTAPRPDSPRSLQPGGTTGGFVQKIGANSFTVNPRGRRFPSPPVSSQPAAPAALALSNGPVELEEAALPRAPGLRGASATASPKPVPSPSAAAVALSPTQANPWKPKSEETVELSLLPPPPPSASPDSSATAGSPHSVQPLVSNGTFEIRPAPKPDLAAIPAHDLQAQVLASLRLNSRNSFLVVPRRKGEAPRVPEPVEALPALPGAALPAVPEKQAETSVPVTYIDEDLAELEYDRFPPLKALSRRLEGFHVPHDGNLALEMEDSPMPMYRSHPGGFAAFSQKNGNTFTIVPRKPPAAGLETFIRALLPEEEDEEEEGRAGARTGAPHQELGHLLKKRYPTVNEIEVIGGYLSLDKSCMSKSGSRRKKMKISFNETSLQTMFEYPSESSLVEEEEEEEEEYATEVDETPAPICIPRPTSTTLSNATNSGLSNYTPKHSLEFGKWQEKQYEGTPPSAGAFPQDADPSGNQVMLTPADQSSLSDFSSEPALYF